MPKFYSIDDISEMFNVHQSSIRRWLDKHPKTLERYYNASGVRVLSEDDLKHLQELRNAVFNSLGQQVATADPQSKMHPEPVKPIPAPAQQQIAPHPQITAKSVKFPKDITAEPVPNGDPECEHAWEWVDGAPRCTKCGAVSKIVKGRG